MFHVEHYINILFCSFSPSGKQRVLIAGYVQGYLQIKKLICNKHSLLRLVHLRGFGGYSRVNNSWVSLNSLFWFIILRES